MDNWRNGTYSTRYFLSSKNYNWRVRHPQIENERNLNRPNEKSEKANNWRVRHPQIENERNLNRPNGKSEKSNNWHVRHPQIENERNLNRPNENSTLFHSLQYLIKINNKNCDDIILHLIEKLDRFVQFLESDLEDDWIVLTIAILAKVCSSCFRQNKFAILKTVAETSFLQKLDNYVQILHCQERADPEKNEHFWKNVEEFFVNLLFVCDFFTEVVPNKACEMLPKLLEAVDMAVLYLEVHQNIEIDQITKQNVTILQKKLNLCEQRSREDKSRDSPLNDFRKWNVAMTSKDILKSDDIAASNYFVDGRYDNVEHYLEVQFRLLKEHFVAPYREHVTKCIENLNKINVFRKLSEDNLYTDVIFHSIVFTAYGVKVILKFSKQETINDIFSERSNCYFRPNTLVFLTKDNFLSVLIGHVILRDYEQQHLEIRFEPEHTNYDLNGSYTMLGTKILYQPYYYALKALQCMSEVDFPMKKYFVDADFKIEPPGYLNSSCSVYTIQGEPVDLFGNNWPSADQLKLDSSQYSAFKAALTQKFNVIQGFPGTGKTHLALQIVKTLLHVDNREIWYNGTPILIVTSSNQALDTFLEGLMSTTRKIIRVGNNVTNGEIAQFLLPKESFAHYITAVTWKKKIAKLSEQIEKWIRHLIRIKKVDGRIDFTLLETTIDENVKTSWFSQASNADLNAWLFDKRKNQNANPKLMEISEIINDVLTKVEKNFDCEDDVTSYQEQETISAEPERTILLSKPQLWITIVKITKQLQNLKTQINQTDNVKKLEARLIILWKIYQLLQVWISDQVLSQPPVKPTNVDYDSPHDMDLIDRWNLYFYWLNLHIRFVEKRIVELQCEHRELVENSAEIKNIINLGIMKSTLVLGMTLHAAHRLQTTLKALKCRIMVVEEASQIFDSQLVISLTKHCENFILLSDHHKLCRNIAGDNINKLKSSAINLIERMANNKMQWHILSVQHRMSAKISKLFVPHFYPEFDTYHLVTQNPAVLGISTCMFYINQEPQDMDENSTTEYYLYEAKFLINLARYMRQIGYQPEDITILSAYSDQTQILRNESKKYEHLLENVRIDFVVNYYQESKVILLSMALNNLDKKLGYLEYESGIIFALSRAKECLYMIGNINLYCENSKTWPRVKKVLMEQNSLGNYFPVCCQINPDHITQIKTPEDFDKISNEVCSEICGSALNCGHRCLKSCHISDCDRIKSTTGTEVCLM